MTTNCRPRPIDVHRACVSAKQSKIPSSMGSKASSLIPPSSGAVPPAQSNSTSIQNAELRANMSRVDVEIGQRLFGRQGVARHSGDEAWRLVVEGFLGGDERECVLARSSSPQPVYKLAPRHPRTSKHTWRTPLCHDVAHKLAAAVRGGRPAPCLLHAPAHRMCSAGFHLPHALASHGGAAKQQRQRGRWGKEGIWPPAATRADEEGVAVPLRFLWIWRFLQTWHHKNAHLVCMCVVIVSTSWHVC